MDGSILGRVWQCVRVLRVNVVCLSEGKVFAMIYKFWHGICVSLIVSTIHWYVDNLINQTIVKHSSPLSKRTK